METKLIMVKSITYAMKGRTILSQNGIISTIQRTPKTGGEKSCGYSLQIDNNAEKALELLKANDINIVGIIDKENIK